VQLMWSKDIIVSNITLLDSPFWSFHPYDCKNITVSNVTIIAPLIGAPNTDGIDPGNENLSVVIIFVSFLHVPLGHLLHSYLIEIILNFYIMQLYLA
jgi:polygalacturonase